MNLHELDLIAVKAHAVSFQVKDLLDYIMYLKYTIDVDYEAGKEEWNNVSPELEEELKHKVEQFINLCAFASRDMAQHLESTGEEKKEKENEESTSTGPKTTESDSTESVQEPTSESK